MDNDDAASQTECRQENVPLTAATKTTTKSVCIFVRIAAVVGSDQCDQIGWFIGLWAIF